MKHSLFRALLLGLFLFFSLSSAYARDYREKGFKGSAGVSTQIQLNIIHAWEVGLDLSLGTMLNSNHYVGGEISLLSLAQMPYYVYETRLSINYMAYCLDRDSTPVLGVKTGAGILSPGFTQLQFYSVFLEPLAGWSWRFPSGYGLTLSAGLDLNHSFFPIIGGSNPCWLFVAPKISFAFEF